MPYSNRTPSPKYSTRNTPIGSSAATFPFFTSNFTFFVSEKTARL